MPLSWLGCSRADPLADRSWLAPRERLLAASLRFPKRREEFLLRRWTAKQALAASLGLAPDAATLARLEARSAPGGAPEPYLDGRPLSVALSLSDRMGRAVCAVDNAGRTVGCDVELVEPRTPVFVGDWFTAAERGLVADAGADRDLVANLVWSAKESALKVLRTGLRRDTRSVEVRLAPGPPYDGTRWRPFGVRVDDGRLLAGWWRCWDRFVVTVASDRLVAPPVPLVPGCAQAPVAYPATAGPPLA